MTSRPAQRQTETAVRIRPFNYCSRRASQPLHSAASLLAQMELHGIAAAKTTVAPADEVADAATQPGEAPDAATLRPPQGAGVEKAEPGTAAMPNDAASMPTNAAATTSARADPTRQQQAEGPAATNGADDWQSQPPPASGLLLPFIRDLSASGEPSTPPGIPPDAAMLAGPLQPTPARRTGSGGAQAQQLPDLGSGFDPADVPLRRSASDVGESGSWPPFDAAASPADGATSVSGSGSTAATSCPAAAAAEDGSCGRGAPSRRRSAPTVPWRQRRCSPSLARC